MHETVTRRQQSESLKTESQHGYDRLLVITSSRPPQALSTDSIERLPVYNKTALKNYQVSQKADDWCIPSKEPLDLSNYKVAK